MPVIQQQPRDIGNAKADFAVGADSLVRGCNSAERCRTALGGAGDLTVSTDKSAGALTVVAGLIAAVKLARVESGELQNRSPRVRSAIADSITIAKMLITEAKARHDLAAGTSKP
jgi:hypothetical protein